MRRTTEQWEALLDGTTPGPWREDSDDGILGRRKGEVEDWELDPVVGHMHRDSDNTLASFAPAAVAEVIRLLKAIKALRDDSRRNAEAAAWLAQGGTDSLEPIFSELADDLTRLLNGDNHE